LFYNPLAAVPSLHVGFAFAIAVALAASLRPGWAQALVLLWGPLVTLSVIATGNHYIFDVIAGPAVTALGFVACELSLWRLRRGRFAESPDSGVAGSPARAGG
jgi:membrane-associated phospholipid phosphatase